MDWGPRLDSVARLHDKVAKIHSLSIFGRAFASAGYCMSTILYHAAFGDLPSPPAVIETCKHAARLVDGRVKRASQQHTPRIIGVEQDMQSGHPRSGGFGALPLRQHVYSRHARWAIQLAASGAQPPSQHKWWVHTARALIAKQHSLFHLPADPLMLLEECGRTPNAISWCPSAGVLNRLCVGMRNLPPLTCVPLSNLPEPGPWCAAMPLWGNRLLACLTSTPANTPPTPLHTRHMVGDVLSYTDGKITTIGDAVQWQLHLLSASQTQQLWVQFLNNTYPVSKPAGLEGARGDFPIRLNALLDALPSTWVIAARNAVLQQVDTRAHTSEAHNVIINALRWKQHANSIPYQPAAPPAPPPLIESKSASVRHLTELQLGVVHVQRFHRHKEYACEALPQNQPPPSDEHAAGRVRLLLSRAWDIRWENRFKEVLWRITVDGGRHLGNQFLREKNARPTRCFCQQDDCSRRHHYHECAVAQAVHNEIQRVIPDCPELQCHHIWLAVMPMPDLHADIWLVVCMAALTAIEYGRQRLASLSLNQRATAGQDSLRQTLITDFFDHDESTPPTVTQSHTSTPLESASAAAATQFWAVLHNFACIGFDIQKKHTQRQWQREIPSTHPILGLVTSTDGDCRFVVQGGP